MGPSQDCSSDTLATQIAALADRSDAKGLIHLAGHGATLFTTAACVFATSEAYWLLATIPVHGLVLVFLFCPLHETIHRTAFKTRRRNDAVAWICGALLLLPPQYFRAFHFAHHRHTQDPDRDPELATFKPQSLGRYCCYVSGIPYWRERLLTLIRHSTGRIREPFIFAGMKAGVIREARLMLGLYSATAAVSILFETWSPVLYWIAPALLGQPFLRLYLLAEHTGCPLVSEMLHNSRTTHTNGFIRRLAWNMSYHAEHHAFTALPFHALPEAHRLLADRISVQSRGYLQVHREILHRFMRSPAKLKQGSASAPR